jgi:hypothetical protein
MKQEIKLGQKVMDTVTGFQGTVVVRAEYLDGEVTYYCVQPPVGEDGNLPEGEYFSANRLTHI